MNDIGYVTPSIFTGVGVFDSFLSIFYFLVSVMNKLSGILMLSFKDGVFFAVSFLYDAADVFMNFLPEQGIIGKAFSLLFAGVEMIVGFFSIQAIYSLVQPIANFLNVPIDVVMNFPFYGVIIAFACTMFPCIFVIKWLWSFFH